FTSRFDERFKEGDRSILMSKFASSAAHLTGKKSTSAESFTWMAEHFCETLEETKAFGDLLFLSGVNRLYYHATVYSPDSAPWPGWCFYAASELNPRNPIWRDIKPLNDYFTRVQSFLAEAVPDNDVLLYWPINDQWTDPEGFESLMTVHAHWMEDIPFGKLAQRLWDGGWQFDYVSDSFLTDEIVSKYKAIVVPEAKVMKPEAIARLNELSKQMPVIFEKDGDAIEALKKTSAKPVAGLDGVEAIRFKWRGGSAYFVVNTSVVDSFLSIPGGTVLLHPLASDTDRRRRQFIPDDVGVTAMRLRPAQSVIMWMAEGGAPENVGIPAFSEEFGFARVKLGDWSLEFKSDVSGWELPPAHAKVTPGDWTKLGEKEAEFSGSAVYKTTFSLTKREAGRPSGIKLGDVAHTARVRVNGREIATLIMHPYMCDIPDGVLQEGVNTLEVEVTNLGANRIRAYDRKGIKWKTFEDANMASYRGKGLLDAKDWPVLPSGLMGPVKILAYDPNPPEAGSAPRKELRPPVRRRGAAKPSIVQRERWPDGFARSDWFADFSPVDESKLGTLYRAEDFGAKADEPGMQTEALQGAVDKIASLGGGVLVLGPGTWNSSSLFFKPGVHMKLEKGAVLKGPADGKLAPRIPSRIEGQSVVYNAALVNADRCDGFTLYGEGTIDGNGKATWAAFWDGRKNEKGFKNTALDRPRNVFVSNSKNVRVSGLSIKDSHFWTVHFHKCELVKLDNLRITAPGPENPPKAPSSDAIDLDVVADCHIWNTYMDVNDDGIALKGGKYHEAEKLPENGENVRILIENCTFGKVVHSAITCGSEALHCKNIVLRNCKLEGCGNLLNMKSRPDTKQLYEDILIENVTGECRNVVQAKPWSQYFTLPEGVAKQQTQGRRITFRGCTVKGAVNIKIDPEFMDFEEPVYENCKFD
ncbi:MAG: hypothetical protein K6F50_03115, partial [Kiritimatiellae bacterium]|nr:hypothetical protein [Kiritimatiellia bacterium]